MKNKSAIRFDKIKNFILEYHKHKQGYLSVRQIAAGTSIPAPSVQRYISDLKSAGEVSVDPFFGIEVTESVKISKEYAVVGLLGSIVCSTPNEPELFFDEYYKLPSSLIGTGDFYFVRAKGESMINAGIKPGDLVLIKQQSTAEPGQIVVALVGDSTTLKRYYPKDGFVVLHPENDNTVLFSDIVLEGSRLSDFSIQGIAVKVLRDLD